MTNGPFSLTGGFWALLLQAPGGLTLHITNAASGFATRVDAPSGTNNPATVPATLPTRFYRLFKT